MRNEFWRVNLGHVLIVLSFVFGMAISAARMEAKFDQVEKRVARIENFIDNFFGSK